MHGLEETDISKAILNAYHERLSGRTVSDVLIVGAGPAGDNEKMVRTVSHNTGVALGSVCKALLTEDECNAHI